MSHIELRSRHIAYGPGARPARPPFTRPAPARVAAWYTERLSGQDLLETPHIAATTTRMSWFVYVVRVKPPLSRDGLMQALAAAGIPSRPYFTPIHLQPFYVQRFGYKRGDFPVTDYLGDVSLALPFSSVMTEDEVDCVCREVLRVLDRSTVPTEVVGR